MRENLKYQQEFDGIVKHEKVRLELRKPRRKFPQKKQKKCPGKVYTLKAGFIYAYARVPFALAFSASSRST